MGGGEEHIDLIYQLSPKDGPINSIVVQTFLEVGKQARSGGGPDGEAQFLSPHVGQRRLGRCVKAVRQCLMESGFCFWKNEKINKYK